MNLSDNSLKSDGSSAAEVNSVKPRSWIAYIFVFLGAFCSGLSSLCIKISDPDEKALFVLIRCSLQFIVLYPYMSFKKMTVIEPRLFTTFLLFIRGLLGSLGMFTLAYAMNYLSLGDAVAIFYTFPVLVGVFAFLFLKEKCAILNVALTLVAMVGTIFITQPPFLFGYDASEIKTFSTRAYGVILAVCSAICTAITFVVVRKLGPTIHFCKSVFYFSWVGALFSVVYLAVSGQPLFPCFQSLPVIVGGSISLFLAQCFLTVAYQREKAGLIALVQTTEVPLAFLLQFLVLDTTPTLHSFIGAALILLCFILLTIKSIKIQC